MVGFLLHSLSCTHGVSVALDTALGERLRASFHFGMRVGGKRKLLVPATLAYGERSMGAHIKPDSNLVFEIELLEVLTRDD